MNTSEQQRRLEAWYAKAQNYDKSWLAPHFSTWRKGKSRPRGEPPPASTSTVFDRLVKLGVLEKIEGPISKRREWEEGT